MQVQSTFTAKPWQKGGPCSRFCKKYGLDEKSHPADWLNSLLPLTPKDNLEDLSETDVTGKPGHNFAEGYNDLRTDQIMQIFGTYILDGPNPSPIVTYKMITQSVDKVQGNCLIAMNMGAGAELRYKIFYHFFGVQDPFTMAPAKHKCPNYKVDFFFRWLRHIWKKV
eukprot:15343475-Ditylum_brightwellii.AAC.3